MIDAFTAFAWLLGGAACLHYLYMLIQSLRVNDHVIQPAKGWPRSRDPRYRARSILPFLVVWATGLWITCHMLLHAVLTTLGVPCP